MPRSFAVTWDYRCPFARNAHEHVLAGLAGGADWDVTWVAFSLAQVHVAEGEPPIWDRPGDDTGLYALQAGALVRERFPIAFPVVHRALFAARHDEGRKIVEPEIVLDTLGRHLAKADVDEVAGAIESGEGLALVRKDHEWAAGGPGVWGVPTFVGPTNDAAPSRAIFVRLMDRNPGLSEADQLAGATAIERVLDLVEGWPELNEFKATRIPR